MKTIKESTIKLTHQELRDLLNKINKHTPNKELENGSSIAHIYNKLTIAYYKLPENLR
tara:strand:+ start:170 stop:343 length:174 start_codon:yes stop_codon:yes gene_type:complete